MALLQAAHTQVQIWSAYTRLNTEDIEERRRALNALVAAGPAALTCLRFASGPLRPPRVQYAAAVGLHRLGEREGLTLLCTALRWNLPARPEIQADLEAAFMSIGLPDAVTALLDLYPHLPGRDPLLMGCLCNIWAALLDPRALDILTAPTWQLPDLFRAAVPRFGHLALGPLERMTREPEASRRLLAVSALHHIPFARSLEVLRPLLYDPDPAVRDAVPPAMAAIDPIAATGIVARAVRDGYSSANAIQLIIRHSSRIEELLLTLVARWDPQRPDLTHDTPEAVLAALPMLTSGLPDTMLFPPLCALLGRQPDTALTSAIVRLLNTRLRDSADCAELVRDTLSARLTHPDKEVRREVGQALDRIGEPLGRRLNQWLDDCWPHENLISRLQMVLRGDVEAGQAATQAMQQVSQWFNRLSREAADRLTTGGSPQGGAVAANVDPRLPDALRQTLGNGLLALRRETLPDRIEAAVALCIAAIRALERIGPQAAPCAYDELLAALHIVKYRRRLERETVWPATGQDRQEVGELVRASAASLLLSCYGADSYGLFLAALHAPQPEIHRTAILALGRLGDTRALPYLHAIASRPGDPNAGTAQEAISGIRRINPEVMTLLRGSQQGDASPATLLRHANGNNARSMPDLLLRPAEGECVRDERAKPGIACDSST
jgi:hypothetical protein